jgi:phytoene dehydrogenase-like protein
MSRRVFDVVVVGGELCGLAAAALLAHAGKRVALIDEDDRVARVLGDRLCPVAPSLWRMPQQGPVAAVFEGLGLKADARRLLGDTTGLGVVDDDDLRCVVPTGEEARVRELSRCFGATRGAALAAKLDAFDGGARAALVAELATLHEDGWWFEARRARRRVAALGDAGRLEGVDDGVRALWGDGDALAPVVGQLRHFVQCRADADVRGLAGFVAASQLCAGVPTAVPLGARPALHDLLRHFVLHHGGEAIADRVESFAVDGSRVTTLTTTAQRLEILPRVVIDATVTRDLATRLPPSRRQAKLLAQQGRVTDAGAALAVRWLLPARALPRGMPPTLLVLAEGGPPVLVAVSPGALPADAGKTTHLDDRLVCVAATATTPDTDLLSDVLRRVLPFADDAVRARDVVDARGFHGPYTAAEAPHHLGGRRPRTPFKNLMRAGRDLAPHFGIDGEIVAARSVVALVDRALPPPPK